MPKIQPKVHPGTCPFTGSIKTQVFHAVELVSPGFSHMGTF